MHLTFKPLLLLSLLCLFITACSSHSSPPPGMDVSTPEAKLEMLHAKLRLTQEQMDAMLPILVEEYEENSQRMESMKEKSGKKARQAMERIREEFQVRAEITREAFASILSEEQLAQYDWLMDKLKKEQEENMPAERGGGKGGGRPRR